MDIIQDALALMMSGSGSSPVLDTVKFTVNGTFTPSVGVDGWNEVEVDVQPNLGTKNISDNGTYTASTEQLDGYSSVTVDVQPTLGTKSITANGTYTASSDNLDGYSSVTVNIASSAISSDSESLSYMAYKNGKTIFDVETGYYILPKIEATTTAGRSTWNVHLYAPDGTDVETFSCGITAPDADIVKYDFAGFGVTINEQHTSATGRGYVKYLPSNSFLNSSKNSDNLLNYFAGNQGYIVGDIPT